EVLSQLRRRDHARHEVLRRVRYEARRGPKHRLFRPELRRGGRGARTLGRRLWRGLAHRARPGGGHGGPPDARHKRRSRHRGPRPGQQHFFGRRHCIEEARGGRARRAGVPDPGRGQPQRHLCQQGEGRLCGLAQRRRDTGRKVPVQVRVHL
ncbi:MAG: FHA-domain-containing protein, partial [uncultured Rubrobacteraceae bacterium]